MEEVNIPVRVDSKTEKVNTFVVAHYNYKDVVKTLESIRRNTPPNFYIILVDQNPECPDLTHLVDIQVKTKRKLGFAKAMNTGIRLADTKYVTCWNDDAECINPHWWEGIELTFKDNPTALGVNPSSPRNPGSPGGGQVDERPYKENYSDEEYQELLDNLGHGWVIDGICTWGTVYNRELLDKVPGVIPGKAWYDEFFWPGGGEDYDLNRRAYMSGLRMLGTGHSFVWHWWYGSNDGKVNFSYGFNDKWGEGADIYGHGGIQDIRPNKVKPLEECPER